MNRILSLLAVTALFGSCGPSEQSGGKTRGRVEPVPEKNSRPPAAPASAVADGFTEPPAAARVFSPELAAYVRDNFAPAVAAAEWRNALSDPSVRLGIKNATVIKLGEDKNAEAVPLLLEHLMEIHPEFSVTSGTMYPCRNALIQIREPAVSAVSDRFLLAETHQERFVLFCILQTISGGEWALEWLESVRDVTPFMSNEEFTRYWTFAETTAAYQKNDVTWHPKDQPPPPESPYSN